MIHLQHTLEGIKIFTFFLNEISRLFVQYKILLNRTCKSQALSLKYKISPIVHVNTITTSIKKLQDIQESIAQNSI